MCVCARRRKAKTRTQMSVCCVLLCVCVCERDGASVGVQEACWRRGVASKLQKKLIKNEKRERKGGRRGKTGVDGSSRGWTEGGGKHRRRRRRRKKREREEAKEWKEGSSVLLKTGGQTVCNWLGPPGLTERFKERREGDREQINR